MALDSDRTLLVVRGIRSAIFFFDLKARLAQYWLSFKVAVCLVQIQLGIGKG